MHYVIDSDEFLELHEPIIQLIQTNSSERRPGVWLTDDTYAEHPLIIPIVRHAQWFVKQTWNFDSHKAMAWGIQQKAGEAIPEHDHESQRVTVVYYLDPGNPPARINIEGEWVDPIAGRFVTFPGTAVHSVERNVGVTDRFGIGMCFE